MRLWSGLVLVRCPRQTWQVRLKAALPRSLRIWAISECDLLSGIAVAGFVAGDDWAVRTLD